MDPTHIVDETSRAQFRQTTPKCKIQTTGGISTSTVVARTFTTSRQVLTMLLRNWLSRKWVATWAGSRLNRILLLECCSASISRFSSLAWTCQRKSSRAVHSTCRPCRSTARTNVSTSTTLKTCAGIIELKTDPLAKTGSLMGGDALTSRVGRSTRTSPCGTVRWVVCTR